MQSGKKGRAHNVVHSTFTPPGASSSTYPASIPSHSTTQQLSWHTSRWCTAADSRRTFDIILIILRVLLPSLRFSRPFLEPGHLPIERAAPLSNHTEAFLAAASPAPFHLHLTHSLHLGIYSSSATLRTSDVEVSKAFQFCTYMRAFSVVPLIMRRILISIDTRSSCCSCDPTVWAQAVVSLAMHVESL